MSDPIRFGCRWWHDGLVEAQRPGGLWPVLAVFGGTAAIGSGGCALIQLRDEMDVEMDALALQKQEGWRVGSDERLDFPGATPNDVDGGQHWREALSSLPAILAPVQASLLRFYVPTVFQSITVATGADLRAALTPISTDTMRAAFARGQSLTSLFEDGGWPTDVAVVVDLPGPDAVAFAAGMAERFDPVFQLDNWPHPLGVVPSHLTLAAALYYEPLFERTRQTRPQPAPPVFVLDADRLAAYTDEEDTFDNRWFARLPDANALAQLGIHHVLYVTENGTQRQELDDLNDTFVAYGQAGIDVKMLALTDFSEVVEETELWRWDFGFRIYCWFGGSPVFHHCFWDYYGWPCPKHPIHVGHPPIPPRPLSAGVAYRPVPRQTLFTGARPQLLGRVAARTSRWDGHVTSLRLGPSRAFAPVGRSGSIGRMSASFGG